MSYSSSAAARSWPATLGLWFVAGFLSTLTFHQALIALLHGAGIVPFPAWRLQPVPPFGVPSVLSLAYWGGVWGVVLAAAQPLLPRAPVGYWVATVLAGGIATTLVGELVVAPLKGAGPATVIPVRFLFGVGINGVWALGTAILARLAPRRPGIG